MRQADNLLVNRELQDGLRASQAKSVAALEQTMASFLRQYETNRKSWVEVLNQQRELANMRYTLITADQQWLALSLRLAAMTGLLDKIAGADE
jgi:adhesin transport system outer membrane protein